MNLSSITKRFTLIYSCLQAEYFVIYGCIGTFASVFLKPLGYTNGEIGMILGTAYLLAVIVQPFLADFADQSKRFSLTDLLIVATLATLGFSIALFTNHTKTMALTICYISAYCIHLALPPLLNQLNFAFEHIGIVMNFGLARAVGSIGFSLISIVLGHLVEGYGIMSIPISIVITLTLTLICLILLDHRYKHAEKVLPVVDQEHHKEKDRITLKEFMKGHKMLMWMNIGVMLLIFHNVIYTTYMYQIILSVGGSTVEMGQALGIMAFLEVPALMYYEKLHQKLSAEKILKISLGGFLIKNVMYIFAKSVTAIYVAQCCQLIGFALFMPSMISYIHERTYKAEETKGQALFSTMFTAGGIIGNYFGGFLIDHCGVPVTLYACFVLSLIGSVIIYITSSKIAIIKK